jgi:hypothetical protein
VLSDSFSEDRPAVCIYALGKAPVNLGGDSLGKQYSDTHLAIGSQLIYNLESHQSLLLAALTSERWMTALRLGVAKSASEGVRVVSYAVDSTGTTEIEIKESLKNVPPENQIELSLSVPPGQALASERLLFSAGPNYHQQLLDYAEAVERLHHARVSAEAPSGWWSWTAYYTGITEGFTLTNAQWLAEHLEKYGYKYIMDDEGYEYAYGEYATPDATKFPHGLLSPARRICNLGLKFGLWTAPFEVSDRAWVYQHHKEWLVHNAAGNPIRIVGFPADEPIYVLDSTHPGAQEYLRQTYRTMAREWGVRYFKFDFMDDTAIEGFHYRPETTALQAERMGLGVIRKAVGDDVLIDKDGSPMLNPVGIVDTGRVSLDTAHSFAASKAAAPGIAARYYMHRHFFVNDPDAFSVSRQSSTSEGGNLSLEEAEVAIVLAAVSGSMFENGDDLTFLENEPERLALLQNHDLLQMVKLNRAAVPIDLMTYANEDEQPSIFVSHQDARQTMLAVFNWTDAPRSHSFSWTDLELPAGHEFEVSDVLRHDASVAASPENLELRDQSPHSVRLIKLVDKAVPAEAPTPTLNVPTSAEVAKAITVSASCDPHGVPAISYHWEFGDGTSADGPQAAHAYTQAGTYSLKVTTEGVDGLAAEKTVSITVTGAVNPAMQFKQNRRYIESR